MEIRQARTLHKIVNFFTILNDAKKPIPLMTGILYSTHQRKGIYNI